jgi:hypothetical protein
MPGQSIAVRPMMTSRFDTFGQENAGVFKFLKTTEQQSIEVLLRAFPDKMVERIWK